MSALLAWLSNQVDVTGCVLLVLAVVLYVKMNQYERVHGSTFRMVDFFTDKDGRADKYSLAYNVILGISVWLTWYLALHDRITEWYITAIIYAFVLGAAWKSGVSFMRDKVTAESQPDPAPPLVQTTEVKQTTTQTVPAEQKKGRKR